MGSRDGCCWTKIDHSATYAVPQSVILYLHGNFMTVTGASTKDALVTNSLNNFYVLFKALLSDCIVISKCEHANDDQIHPLFCGSLGMLRC